LNPRIYKKQAKRAVELLRSHSAYGNGLPDVYKCDRWDHPEGDYRTGIGIDGCPVFGWWSSTPDGREWDEKCTRTDWIEHHYWMVAVPDGYFKSGDEPWPKMTQQQKRERFKRSQIAPGWRWRGGRAVRIAGAAP
jgi:hypothetical protein